MKIKFLTIKKKALIVFLLCLLVLGGGIASYYTIDVGSSPKPLHTIVIDAGHGGADVKLGQYVF